MTKHKVGDLLLFDMHECEIGVIIEIHEQSYMPYTVKWTNLGNKWTNLGNIGHFTDKLVRKYKANFNKLSRG